MPDAIYNRAGMLEVAFAANCGWKATIPDKACRAAICRIAANRMHPERANDFRGLLQSPHGVSPRSRRLAMSVGNAGGPKANHSSSIW